MKKVTIMFAIFSLGAIAFQSCKKKEKIVYVDNTPPPPPASAPTLYTRLGGISAISSVVDQFITNCATNSLIGSQFAATAADVNRLKVFRFNLIDQICQGTGGPCQYKGATMLASHAGMGITDADFDALVGELVNAMNQFSVPSLEQGELAAILLPMRADIVE